MSRGPDTRGVPNILLYLCREIFEVSADEFLRGGGRRAALSHNQSENFAFCVLRVVALKQCVCAVNTSHSKKQMAFSFDQVECTHTYSRSPASVGLHTLGRTVVGASMRKQMISD